MLTDLEGEAVFSGPALQLKRFAAKHSSGVFSATGTIDSGYRGEIAVILINHGQDTFTINRGDRIAQLVIAALAPCELESAADLDETDRGSGGFGSSGR